jgi:transcriptional regulator with XRE-family HTH domain
MDIKQSELARKTGITKTTISNYVNAKKMPQLSVVEKIADVLNISVDYLLGRSNKPQKEDIFDISTLSSAEINDVKVYIEFLKFKKKNLKNGESI